MLDKVCHSIYSSGLLISCSFSSLLCCHLLVAISYECISTVATIYPNNSVVAKTARSLSRFVTSTNNNWRYLGINGLALLVQVPIMLCSPHDILFITVVGEPQVCSGASDGGNRLSG